MIISEIIRTDFLILVHISDILPESLKIICFPMMKLQKHRRFVNNILNPVF